MELLPAHEGGCGGERLRWPNLAVGERPVSAVMQKGAPLMPLRRSSADISVVYLLLCLHLCIAKGTNVKPDSVYQGCAPQWRRYKCSVSCCHQHTPSDVCLRHPTRQNYTPLVNAKYRSPICPGMADGDEGLGHFA